MNAARAILALVPCLLSVVVAAKYLQGMALPGSIFAPFTDAITYLAAGERLNDGHALYALQPGDRSVAMIPGVSGAPLLSPPLIAVIWRPLAALPIGFALWVAACWVALLGTTYFLVYRVGLRGAVVCTALAPAIGEQLAVCNVAAFFPLLLVTAWRRRDTVWAGAIVGALTSLKLSPGTLFGWLAGTRAWQSLLAATLVVGVALGLSVLGAGLGSIGEYISVARGAGPSSLSLSGLTGIPWLSPAILVVGAGLALLIGRQRPDLSFGVAVSAAVFGTPALYLSGLVTLLATLAPLATRVPLTTRADPAIQEPILGSGSTPSVSG